MFYGLATTDEMSAGWLDAVHSAVYLQQAKRKLILIPVQTSATPQQPQLTFLPHAPFTDCFQAQVFSPRRLTTINSL